MRLSLKNKAQQPRTGARRDLRQERFQAYFPRVFAYACSVAGDDDAARDIVVSAFASTFTLPDMREPEFEVAIFRAARDEANHSARHSDGLTARERDVIALVFDAQLQQAQIAELMGASQDNVSITLAKGLRKLQANFAPEATPAPRIPSYS